MRYAYYALQIRLVERHVRYRDRLLKSVVTISLAMTAFYEPAIGLDRITVEQSILVAQAGSTGGMIGKQDKSASGGEEIDRKHRAPQRAPQGLKSGKLEQGIDRRAPGASRSFLDGQWKWNADCAFGNWGGVITIVQTSASTFHGGFGGQGPADVGTITDGTLRGKHISFLRHEPNNIVEHYDANLVSMEPPMFKGNHVHHITGACQFTGAKMK